MSTFGLIMTLMFLLLMGGLVMLTYNGDGDIGIAKAMMAVLYVLVFVELVLMFLEYPIYVVDGIVFACMGYKWLANVMFGIVGAILLFIIYIVCSRIKWRKFLEGSAVKLIVTGVLFIVLLAGTELWNGAYSFDSMEEFKQVKETMEPYDNHFFPTKYIKHENVMYKQECVAVYPFDVTTAAGKQPIVYKADIFEMEFEDGTTSLYYYPFTWKRYDMVDPVDFEDATYVPPENTAKVPITSPTDASASDAAKTEEAKTEEAS